MQEQDEAAAVLEQTEQPDINDVFNDIFLIENRMYTEGFREGIQRGKDEGNIETFRLGYQKGVEIGSEIGYYTGVAETYLSHFGQDQSKKADKIVKELAVLKKLLDEFPRDINEDVDVVDLLNQIRAKFKKACAILKITPIFPKTNELSF